MVRSYRWQLLPMDSYLWYFWRHMSIFPVMSFIPLTILTGIGKGWSRIRHFIEPKMWSQGLIQFRLTSMAKQAMEPWKRYFLERKWDNDGNSFWSYWLINNHILCVELDDELTVIDVEFLLKVFVLLLVMENISYLQWINIICREVGIIRWMIQHNLLNIYFVGDW